MDQQLLREFLADAEDLIEGLSGDIEALRARRGTGRERRMLTGRIFRHVHTLKGAAASIKLETTSRIAHELESLLDLVRLGRLSLNEAVLDGFADAAAALSETLVAAARGEAPAPSLPLIENLRRLARETEGERSAPALAQEALPGALPGAIAGSLSQYELQRLREAAQDGARLYLINVHFDLATLDHQFRVLEDALAGGGEIISTAPGLEGSSAGQLGFRILYAAFESTAELAARLLPFGATTLEAMAPEEQDTQRADARGLGSERESMGQQSVGRQLMGQQPVVRQSVAQQFVGQQSAGPESIARQGSTPESIAPLTTHLRVEPYELDEAIYAAHELFQKTTAMLELAASKGVAVEGGQLIESLATEIRRRAARLEESLIALRLVPLARALRRVARAGLLAARAVGKEIDFELAGEDARLDKSLVDVVSDPLLHLVRNAVDHGIETADERASAGKSARGRVRVEALIEGSRVRLRVRDDGRGIDPSRITRAAREQGIVGASATLNMEEAVRLIFRPGFSTAASVSNVSGRGVGLDVVEQALEQAGGEMRVWSETGAGTVFEILLPTRLVLIPSFVVRSAGHPYCLDASQVADACLINEDEIEKRGDALIYHWRGRAVRLARLRGLLDQPAEVAPASQPLHIVVAHVPAGAQIVSGDEQRAELTIAISVDGWEGYEKVLVRGLGRHAARWQGIGGAAELNDGTLALLLDLPRLLDRERRLL